jgi:exopolysaccharide biosynthesis WecB/TagA/CpsF family protein
METVNILGVTVHSGSLADVVGNIDDRLSDRSPTRVAFLNAHLSNVCAQHRTLRGQLRDFIVLNDGIGVDIARWFLHGAPFKQNLNGTDFTTAYLTTTRHRLRLFLLGAKPDVVARAAERIAARWPHHEVVGFCHGYLSAAGADRLKDRIANLQPDIILVGMGNPLQETWLAENIPALAPLGVAVGAWFDFLTETIPRAPVWCRRAKLEWAYRLALEPTRLARRYLIGNPAFLTRLFIYRLKSVVGGPSSGTGTP